LFSLSVSAEVKQSKLRQSARMTTNFLLMVGLLP
jgi:hypothetical protein